jgi:hypothetical protein
MRSRTFLRITWIAIYRAVDFWTAIAYAQILRNSDGLLTPQERLQGSGSSKVSRMPAQDIYHDSVKNALIKDGWTITHDPYTLTFGQKDVFVDLGAERIIAATKGSEKIAVEIKSFQSASDIRDLELALGQYVLYRSLLRRFEADRKLFLAVPTLVYSNTLQEPIAQPVLADLSVALIAFDPDQEVIVQWTP